MSLVERIRQQRSCCATVLVRASLAVVVIFSVGGFWPVLEAAEIARARDEQSERIEGIAKDVATNKESVANRLDAQDKRVADLGLSIAQQSNHLSIIATYVSWTSIAITLIVALAGLGTYVGVRKSAREEAEHASKSWFEEQGVLLKRQLDEIEKQVGMTTEEIRKRGESAAAEIDAVRDKATRKFASTYLFDAGLLLRSRSRTTTEAVTRATSEAVKAILDDNESLKRKPEAQFTANDYLARGTALVAQEKFASAIEAFDSGLAEPGLPGALEASLLFARAATLRKLGQSAEALLAYADLDRRFADDPSPDVQQFLARALVNAGALQAISQDIDGAIRTLDLLVSRYGTDHRPELREHVATALLNKATLLGRRDQIEEALAIHTDIASRLEHELATPLKKLAARALNGIGFDLILLAKRSWSDEASRMVYLERAIEALHRARDLCEQGTLPMVLGNIGYALFLQHKPGEAGFFTSECLRLGGERARKAQIADANTYPVGEVDARYIEHLATVWSNRVADRPDPAP